MSTSAPPARDRRHHLPLLRGRARFVGDIQEAGQLALRVVRSAVAHGHLRGVDVAAAAATPGVHAVLTAADLAATVGEVPRIRSRMGADAAVAEPYLQPLLATDRVRYVGEPVAVVVADDPYLAEDAAELVVPDIEPLAPVIDPTGAAAGAPLFAGGNEISTLEGRLGDAATAFAEAPVVVEATLAVDRHSAVPIETRGALAVPGPGGGVTLHGAAKVPHWNRDEITRQLGLGPGALRVVESAVGGSFGVRGELYPEDVLVVHAALALGRPVGWIEDRWEHFIATNHGRGQVHHVALAGTEDGRILGLRSEMWIDLGAYVRTNGLRLPELTVGMLPGPYAIDHYEATAHVVATSATPVGTYRGPGRVESAYVRERMIDRYAHRIGADPVEVRHRNLLDPERTPLDRQALPGGPRVVLAEGDLTGLLDEVVARIDGDEIARRQAAGERVGVGLGLFLERSGAGPKEWAELEVEPEGVVAVRTGATSVGQGLPAALARLAADGLGCPPERVRVEPVDTAVTPRGTGTFGSRATTMAGNAVHQAASDLRERAVALVAAAAGAAPDDVEVDDGRYRAGEVDVDLAGLAKLAAERDEDPLRAGCEFTMTQPNSDFGAHAAVARVDEETGEVTVERLVLGFDMGPAVDLALVEGQLRGASAQALGGALYERFAYDGDGNPQVTSFMDYLVPTSAEVPEVEVVVDQRHPSPFNPLGLKGVGEGGMTGVMPAVAGAVGAALGDPALIDRAPIGLDVVRAALADGAGPCLPPPRRSRAASADGAERAPTPPPDRSPS